MTLNIAALRHRAEMAEKFANDGPDAPILDGRLRVFAKDLLALLDAAEERTKLRQYLDDAQDDLWKVREERDRLRSQRDALLASAEALFANKDYTEVRLAYETSFAGTDELADLQEIVRRISAAKEAT